MISGHKKFINVMLGFLWLFVRSLNFKNNLEKSLIQYENLLTIFLIERYSQFRWPVCANVKQRYSSSSLIRQTTTTNSISLLRVTLLEVHAIRGGASGRRIMRTSRLVVPGVLLLLLLGFSEILSSLCISWGGWFVCAHTYTVSVNSVAVCVHAI